MITMGEVTGSITGMYWADRVLFAVFILLLGVTVLHDNHHPNRRDLAAFAVSGLFWGTILLTVANVLGSFEHLP